MFEFNPWRIGLGLMLAAGLVGCSGKPEDTGQSASGAASTTSPAPPYPAWATAMLGKDVKQVSPGAVTCKGVIDVVSAKHTGAHPGSEIEGWAWNETQHRPLAKIVFTDQADRIVGGATVGNPRQDVMAAMSEVKTPAVGWRGVARPISGAVTAVGLTDGAASCVLGSITL
ncbi:hypothetical protein [Caulobacter sp. S45]|uniref:hypothetical protein n=1 Tax=Caulobacter sp. S45 TaxID=1641861 RepID=UPI00157640A4|nr:hypothetical protein [Caulobacter sp. S45]